MSLGEKLFCGVLLAIAAMLLASCGGLLFWTVNLPRSEVAVIDAAGARIRSVDGKTLPIPESIGKIAVSPGKHTIEIIFFTDRSTPVPGGKVYEIRVTPYRVQVEVKKGRSYKRKGRNIVDRDTGEIVGSF